MLESRKHTKKYAEICERETLEAVKDLPKVNFFSLTEKKELTDFANTNRQGSHFPNLRKHKTGTVM